MGNGNGHTTLVANRDTRTELGGNRSSVLGGGRAETPRLSWREQRSRYWDFCQNNHSSSVLKRISKTSLQQGSTNQSSPTKTLMSPPSPKPTSLSLEHTALILPHDLLPRLRQCPSKDAHISDLSTHCCSLESCKCIGEIVPATNAWPDATSTAQVHGEESQVRIHLKSSRFCALPTNFLFEI